MTDLDDLDLMTPTTEATVNVSKRRHVHRYAPRGYVMVDHVPVAGVVTLSDGETVRVAKGVGTVREPVLSKDEVCLRCGKVRDESVVRRNRNNRQRGSAFERSVAKKLGGRRTGPLGGRDDVIVGQFAAVQTKKTARLSLNEARVYLDDLARSFPDRVPLVVHAEPGRDRDAVVILPLAVWAELHGEDKS